MNVGGNNPKFERVNTVCRKREGAPPAFEVEHCLWSPISIWTGGSAMRKQRRHPIVTVTIVLAGALFFTGIGAWAQQGDRSGSSGREARATFAGGCFWCMEPPFDKLDGVISTTSGYAGGHVVNPTYKEVSAGGTGHAEVVQVLYDPERVSYQELLEVFWHNVDPLDPGGQFCDRGAEYRTAIFFHDQEQRRLAEASKRELEQSGRFQRPIVTQIMPLPAFYAAEDYHQDYYIKNPLRYRYYRTACGRDARLRELWKE
jgi:peptide-methionine (S)-S-oxide reductase